MFDKISNYDCIPSYINGVLTVQDSVSYINRYIKLRANAYPSILEYIDAQVKKSSSDQSVVEQGVLQEEKYFADCLLVKQQYPKPQ